MDNPGIYSLGSATITAAIASPGGTITSAPSQDVPNTTVQYIDGLEGMSGLTIQANFNYGGGGPSCSAIIRTSIDGQNWLDIARFDFAQTSRLAVCNLTAAELAPETVAALGVEGLNNGVFGDRIRCDVISTGTYSNNTQLTVTACAR